MPWEPVGRARAPEGGELVLYARGGEYTIRIEGLELMSSRAHRSEEALATLACESLHDTEAPRVLVGGLGMGFTLAAVLRHVPASAQVTVAELVPAVIEWNRGPLAPLAGSPLEDPRVTVLAEDVAVVLRTTRVRFDVVLLDVDNGPTALVRKANQMLYAGPGLALCKGALRPGGCLAVWSAGPAPGFARRLEKAGFTVETHTIPARGVAGDPAHTIFLARTAAFKRPRSLTRT